MAFWGIEVKPGKPYTHLHDNARGRLRICQATLGNGKSASRSVVQCNVGEKAPILLCSLIPDNSETCHLELEFEEDDAVVFSVLGQKSVHLSGYYVGRPCCNLDGDETDSYGEDIAGTDTSGSYDSLDDDDEYESDFIDDDGDEMFLHSPRRKSGVVIEEIVEDEKPSNGNAGRRRLKKKHQLSDSDDDDSKRQIVVKQSSPSIFESEDEDGFPISMHSKNKNAAKGPEGNSKSDDMAVDEDKKWKVDAISQDGEIAGEPADTSLPFEIGVENDEKLKKKKKGRVGKPVETATKASAEEKVNDKLVKDEKKVVKEQKVESSGIETDVTENDSKPKKKKGKGKSETDAVVPVKKTDEEVKEKANEPEKLPTENGQESSVKSKKKNRKRKGKEGNFQETEENTEAIELQKSNTVEQLSNMASGVELTDDDKKDARRKKKKNIEKDSLSNQQAKVEAQSHKPRTFPNGLVIEDLAMGKPDGKRASDGSKVSVNYIGKLKNGTIFDSNVGQRPFKFRLGVGQVIKGWDVGVKGMRVGDKRRLTIPPSFGYGERGAGKKIPGNSWLVFDVELVEIQ